MNCETVHDSSVIMNKTIAVAPTDDLESLEWLEKFQAANQRGKKRAAQIGGQKLFKEVFHYDKGLHCITCKSDVSIPLKKGLEILRTFPATDSMVTVELDVSYDDDSYSLVFSLSKGMGNSGYYLIFGFGESDYDHIAERYGDIVQILASSSKTTSGNKYALHHKSLARSLLCFINDANIVSADVAQEKTSFEELFPGESDDNRKVWHALLGLLLLTHVAESGEGRTRGSDKLARASLRRIEKGISRFEHEFFFPIFRPKKRSKQMPAIDTEVKANYFPAHKGGTKNARNIADYGDRAWALSEVTSHYYPDDFSEGSGDEFKSRISIKPTVIEK